MIWVEQKHVTPGPDVAIECPRCRKHGIASTSDQEHRDLYFGFIPVLTSHRTCVVCPNCKVTLDSRVMAADLASLPPGEVSAMLRHRPSLVQGFLAVVALLLAWLPVAGMIIALIALLVNWRHRGWTKKVCYVAVVVSVLCNGYFLTIPAPARKP
jgi:hypothetical protein